LPLQRALAGIVAALQQFSRAYLCGSAKTCKEGRRHPGSAEEARMAKGQQKKTKEVRKPKKEKPKTIAASPSRGTVNDIKAR
jgi:hypothetical protein